MSMVMHVDFKKGIYISTDVGRATSTYFLSGRLAVEDCVWFSLSLSSPLISVSVGFRG